MDNTERLKNYLIGKYDGYLLNDLSNGKVIMISGEWGSGKTHFWKNEIEPNIKEKAYAYVSLYGKTSISSIENDMYMQIYSSTNNEGNLISKGCSTLLTTYARVFKPLSIINAEESEKLILVSKHKKAIESLEKDAVICFDDFERKSKDVDLNDLFGFITQLALNFNCKIVLILNSDVFEGKEKDIFTTVKEKTISKYLKFNPTCKELFEIIFDYKYYTLKEHKQILQDIFIEVGIINARIFIQVLDNVLEWKNKKKTMSEFYLRYFILSNINFILNHHISVAQLGDISLEEMATPAIINAYAKTTNLLSSSETNTKIKSAIYINQLLMQYIFGQKKYSDKFIKNLKQIIEISGSDKVDSFLNTIQENESLIKSLHFLICFGLDKYGESHNQAEVDILNDISSFIETGIL